jgi:hypothetical protein
VSSEAASAQPRNRGDHEYADATLDCLTVSFSDSKQTVLDETMACGPFRACTHKSGMRWTWRCPHYPRKQTSGLAFSTSALCQEETFGDRGDAATLGFYRLTESWIAGKLANASWPSRPMKEAI